MRIKQYRGRKPSQILKLFCYYDGAYRARDANLNVARKRESAVMYNIKSAVARSYYRLSERGKVLEKLREAGWYEWSPKTKEEAIALLESLGE